MDLYELSIFYVRFLYELILVEIYYSYYSYT